MLDMAIALPLLLLGLPVIGLAALAIRMTSTGAAIYSQPRLGRNERPFLCHKLRSMHVNAPVVPSHEAAPDLIFPVGRFLRRWKIDELPQLWNVVRGEMSLVGPRPSLATQAELVACRRASGVYSALPGITGLSQVRGIDMSRPQLCAQTDAEYIARQSTRVDLAILLQTLPLGRRVSGDPVGAAGPGAGEAGSGRNP